MSYEKTVWATDDVITAEKLNKTEAGVAEAHAAVEANAAADAEQQAAIEANTAKVTEQQAILEANASLDAQQQEAIEANATKIAEQQAALEAQVAQGEAQQAAIAAQAEQVAQQQVDITAQAAKSAEQQVVIDANAAAIRRNATAVAANAATIATLNATVEALTSRLVALEDEALQVKNVVGATLVAETTAYGAEDQDLVVTAGEGVKLTAKTAFTGKTVALTASTIDADFGITVKASSNVVIKDVTLTGAQQKSSGNASVQVTTDGTVRISGVDFKKTTAYNAFEIWGEPKSVIVEDCNIDYVSNVGILVLGAAQGATLTFKNCTFTKVSNAVRWSNINGVDGVTINLVDCKFIETDPLDAYHGVVLLQEITTKPVKNGEVVDTEATWAAFRANNTFGPDKLTINFINCYNEGVAMVPVDLKTIVGSANQQQVIYLYVNALSGQVFDYAHFADCYPTINIQFDGSQLVEDGSIA